MGTTKADAAAMRSAGRDAAGPRDDLPYLLLGQHIRNYRLQKFDARTGRPWSQEDLAVSIGTDKAHVNRIECGRQLPTVDTLDRVCDALELLWPARRRLLGLAGLLKDLPEPREEDMTKIEGMVARAFVAAAYPACLLDHDERIWDVNTEFATIFLGYGSKDACLEAVRGRFFLELLCDTHPAHAYLRRTVRNFDHLSLRLLAVLRHALQRRPGSSQYQALLNDVLSDLRLCSLWLQISAHLNRSSAPEYLDHQALDMAASPVGPYRAQLWHSTFQADERFRLLHLVPVTDEAQRRFELYGKRRSATLKSPTNAGTLAELAHEPAAYPQGPVSFHVPWASGGVTDVGARILAPLLSRKLGQPVSVINCDQTQSQEAVSRLAALRPDGHHLVFLNEPSIIAATESVATVLAHTARVPELSRFDCVAQHAYDPFCVYVRQESRYGSFKELIRDASNRPGEILVGTSGRGTPAHLAALMVEEAAGVRFNFCHYSGSLEHIARFLSGQTDVAYLGSGVSLPAVQAGEMRALLALTPTRFELMPETATLAEFGFAAHSLASIRRIYLPQGSDPAVRNVLRAVLSDVVASPDHVARMAAVGLVPVPAGFATHPS
ncbi:tripartite tricarboxylate transporter substrate-binding protein [Devosia naphthalenivorans]|uniref:tripartite tricarboxylate transporter substrate-binding protein n=1 Tax=Devosia naphthalenivorans TaxID=2082392 RepID=UPI0013B0658F|nr:tripartite tricarboxylate transporter substrate-binding protein [Devosia naphthalenivorans]